MLRLSADRRSDLLLTAYLVLLVTIPGNARSYSTAVVDNHTCVATLGISYRYTAPHSLDIRIWWMLQLFFFLGGRPDTTVVQYTAVETSGELGPESFVYSKGGM